MNQDTRKDPRAKVLTMTVRYKSATLDEFIEHHSYDVSRGGMFIKTPSPFPPGTLLKFEVKIADEQRLMQGVGRVVWKREANDSNDARPSGMGVKFIKIDDESRRTIERLVDARGGDGDNAFDQGNAPPRVPVASAPTATVPSSIPSSTAPTKPLEQPPAPARSRKSTVIGLGAMKPSGISGGSQRAVTISSGPPRTVTPSPPQAQEKPAETFFPKTDSRADMPPVEDQTMMKQAKELLADAMRYAGGTAEDVKAAAKVSSIPPHIPRPEPHKSVPPRPTAKVEVPKTRSPFSEQSEEGEAATTIWRANEAAALLAESMKDSEPPQGEEIHGRITARPPAEAAEPEPRFRDSEPATTPGTSPEEEAGSARKVAAAPPLPTKLKPEHVEDEAPASEPPKPAAKPATAKAPVSVSDRPSSRTRASQAMMEAANEAASEGGGGKGVFALLALAAAAGIGFYVTRPPAAAPEPPPAPVEVAKPAPTPEPTPVATAPETPPSAAVSAAPAESASAAPPTSASAAVPAPEPSASAAPVPAVAEKPAKPAPRRVVVPRRAPVKRKAEPTLSGEESESPPAEAAPKPPADAAPVAPPPTPAPPTPTPPSPTPPPASKPLGDNPY